MKKTLYGQEALTMMLTAPVPQQTKTYTPIPNAGTISQIQRELRGSGFIITKEDYQCTDKANVSRGTYSIFYKPDADIELTISFLNSYNKERRFRFVMGARVKANDASMVAYEGLHGLYRRKHTGKADSDIESCVRNAIQDADQYWETLVFIKNTLRDCALRQGLEFEILGRLFVEHNILNSFQMNLVREQMVNPTYEYNCSMYNSAWPLYNAICLALKQGHPVDWAEKHALMHALFMYYIGHGGTEIPTLESIMREPELVIEEETQEVEEFDEEVA